MEDDEQEQRRRKVEAGRAKLAHFRQRKTKGDYTHSKKKTAKRKGPAVDAPVQEESPVATEDSGFLGGGSVCKTTSCSDTPGGAAAAQLENPDGASTEDLEQLWQKPDGDGLEQPGLLTKECGQECTPEIAELTSQHEDKLGRERWAMVGLPAEMQQLQTQVIWTLSLTPGPRVWERFVTVDKCALQAFCVCFLGLFCFHILCGAIESGGTHVDIWWQHFRPGARDTLHSFHFPISGQSHSSHAAGH
ncbi:pericentrin [Phyllostomus discolor]|uniref:Pericentrin n=1 Tax=Phyllostomus discolor TaxID=89673 RepID=A0A834B463_9CHIR|nr:pericentrin [Phyllostomus discolor]